ncbi:uncharacterized protein VTP21DRAFT_3709 [Calcarisporiella thermophila]|uniref:uncharacterized protein n=1 Tax=Calcarisporiella thermophila TaxID=911321 RepID=UPI0037441B79
MSSFPQQSRSTHTFKKPLGDKIPDAFDPLDLSPRQTDVTDSPFSQSSVDAPLYSPYTDNHDLLFDMTDIEAPVACQSPQSSYGESSFQLHSMSVPSNISWLGSNFDQVTRPRSLQYNLGEMALLNGLFGQEEILNHKHAQLLLEKRRHRRESHNAVERRRRDNINDRIQELATLLPENFMDPNVKPNKGIILRCSCDYIRQLQQQLHQQLTRNQELESLLRQNQARSENGGTAQ